MASRDGGPRKTQKAKVDRLSNLPDEILSHILSLLPIKHAVGTCILSTRWKYLWTSITSLHFHGIIDRRGANIIDQVFRGCSSSHIKKLTLHEVYKYQNPVADVTTWINEAIKRNVSELDLALYSYKLPLASSVFNCRTLRILTLDCFNNVCDKKLASFNLPCLKVLHITGSSHLNDFIEALVSSCPVLEDLTLAGYLEYDKGYFMVRVPTLKTLQLQLLPYTTASGGNKISVIAPNLKNLCLGDYFVEYKIEGEFSSVFKACMNFGDISLYKSYLSFRRVIPQCFALPMLRNLTCLEAITRDNRFWATLLILIRCSPTLEVLSLEQRQFAVASGWMGDGEYDWVEPKSVPKCFGFHLAVIKIRGFNGRKHELQIIKYCLGNAKVLRGLSIDCRGLTQVEETRFCGQVMKLSRASGSCHIQFRGEFTSNL